MIKGVQVPVPLVYLQGLIHTFCPREPTRLCMEEEEETDRQTQLTYQNDSKPTSGITGELKRVKFTIQPHIASNIKAM